MDVSEYITYLLSTPGQSSCVDASSVLEVSHDQVNRFLLSGQYTGQDLFTIASSSLGLHGGVLTVDDTVLDKPYRDIEKTELVDFFYSGKHHRSVKGINLIVLMYRGLGGDSMPINFRLYRHSEQKTKNDYFLDMMREVWQWGLRPALVTMDNWYGSIGNLKFLRNWEVDLLFGLKSNRQISTQPHQYESVSEAEIPSEGLYTHLKAFGFIKLFRTVDPDGNARHYGYYRPGQEELKQVPRGQFKSAKKAHWHIEQFFRCIKQQCQTERFFVRITSAIKTHVFYAFGRQIFARKK